MWRRLLALTLFLAVGVGVGAGWWSAYGGATSLGYRFENAATTAELVEVVPPLLETTSYRVHWMLEQRSQRTPGMAWDGQHGIVVIHDRETGDVHSFIGSPASWGARLPGTAAPGSGPPAGVRVGRETFGTPPRRFAETRCVIAAPGEVWCVLRPADRDDPWLALEFAMVEGAMRRGRTQDLTDDLRKRLRASGQWPAIWGR